MTLFWRLFLWNGLVLLAAALALMLTPVTVSHPVDEAEVRVVVVGLTAMLLVNSWLVSAALRPLHRLREAVEHVQSPSSEHPLPVLRNDEVGHVTAAFNAMLTRLTEERRRATGLSVEAQERERRRVSRELHDGIGQTMTVLLLQLKALENAVPAALKEETTAVTEVAPQALEEVRSVSRELRPGPLEDLGLLPALRALVRDLATSSDLDITLDAPRGLDLPQENELVVYRVVQESLTNVIRHAGATTARVEVRADVARLTVEITDDGTGIAGVAGTGMNGMTERARLGRGRLRVDLTAGKGTTVALLLPLDGSHDPGGLR